MTIFGKSLTVLAAVGIAAQAGYAEAQTARGSLATAQSQDFDPFARDRSVAVRDRPHPGYEAFGVPLGAFTAFPKLQIDGEYTDNVFAVPSGEDDDWIVRFKPELAIESGWSRHALSAYARANISRYNDFETENSEDWGVGAQGRLDVTRATNINASVDYATQTEPRSSSNTATLAKDPIEFDVAQAYVAASHTVGRARMSARADWRSFDYEDGETDAGVVIDQDSRDRDITSATGRFDYAVSPATAWFVQATGNERDYSEPSTLAVPARDSSGYEVLVGANFELGAVARGEVAAGYIRQDFDEAAYGDIDGVGARAQVEWFPTQLTTVTFSGSRTVEDAGIIGAGGYLSSGVGAAIDHELMRNVILSGTVNYSQDDYEGIDRNDDRLSLSASATYLLNRHLGLSLTASRMDQSSEGLDAGSDFTVNRLAVSLVSQF